jgi:hypothetical protein
MRQSFGALFFENFVPPLKINNMVRSRQARIISSNFFEKKSGRYGETEK